jgi:hypothetical protein
LPGFFQARRDVEYGPKRTVPSIALQRVLVAFDYGVIIVRTACIVPLAAQYASQYQAEWSESPRQGHRPNRIKIGGPGLVPPNVGLSSERTLVRQEKQMMPPSACAHA